MTLPPTRWELADALALPGFHLTAGKGGSRTYPAHERVDDYAVWVLAGD